MTTTPPSGSGRLTRRRLLTLLGGGAAGLAGCRLSGGLRDDALAHDLLPSGPGRPRPLEARAITAAPPASRALVVIELAGGNDGLSTVVPYADPAYRRLRDRTAVGADEVVRIDDTFGYHPGLSPCARRLAAVHGVGAAEPTGSHFEMSARWWVGDERGGSRLTTGFLGRVCDALDDGAPVTGVSLAGVTPALLSDRAVTLGLPAFERLAWLLEDDEWSRNLRDGLAALGAPATDETEARRAARTGLARALEVGALLDGVDQESEPGTPDRYPGTELGRQLRSAASLLAANAGIRVVHASIGGFDTHQGQRGAHDDRMRELGEALAAFAADLDRLDLAGSVLVATTSEFGRRAMENDSGTDHGTASCALLLGPVQAGLHGEPPSLTALDDDANLRATASFEQYYATLATSWFGLDAAQVLPSRPRPIDGVIAS